MDALDRDLPPEDGVLGQVLAVPLGVGAELHDGRRAGARRSGGRLALMRSLYEAEPGHPELHLPYRRAALGFMGWQLRRGLLNAVAGAVRPLLRKFRLLQSCLP